MKRWIVRLFVLGLVLVVAAVALAPLVPLDPLKPQVESRLSAALGRQVTAGRIRLNLLGGPFLLIDELTAREDPAFGEGQTLAASQVRLNLALLPLVLRRQPVIEAVDVQSPQFTFTKNASQRWSWTTLGRAGAAGAASSARHAIRQPPSAGALASQLAALLVEAPAAEIDEIHVADATVRLQDQTGAQPPESVYRHIELHARLEDRDGARWARGEFRASSGDEGSEVLRAQLPFDVKLGFGAVPGADPANAPAVIVEGVIGPGPLASRNFAADSLKSQLRLVSQTAALTQMEVSLYEGAWRGNVNLDFGNSLFSAEGDVEHVNLDQALGSKLAAPGQFIGYVSGHVALNGALRDFQQALATVSGSGRVASDNLFLAAMNLSEQVARALRISAIGDPAPGTAIGRVETDFVIEQGVFRTNQLMVKQLDGLGDASASQGWIDLRNQPTINYAATVVLTPDATARVRSSSPLLGAAVALLQRNNQVTVPVSISGALANPSVQVDVTRILH